MSTLIAFIAAYFLLLAVLSVVARPSRVRLKNLSCELLTANLTQSERKMVLRLADSAYSVRTAPLLLLVFITGVLRHSEKLDAESDGWVVDNPTLATDRRSHELLELHMASAAAANPIFGALAYVAKWVFRAKSKAHFERVESGAKALDLYEMKAFSV
jgi:hypothetical protein